MKDEVVSLQMKCDELKTSQQEFQVENEKLQGKVNSLEIEKEKLTETSESKLNELQVTLLLCNFLY